MASCWRDWGKPRRKSVRVPVYATEVQTEHKPGPFPLYHPALSTSTAWTDSPPCDTDLALWNFPISNSSLCFYCHAGPETSPVHTHSMRAPGSPQRWRQFVHVPSFPVQVAVGNFILPEFSISHAEGIVCKKLNTVAVVLRQCAVKLLRS
jgi:hypothetical protein